MHKITLVFIVKIMWSSWKLAVYAFLFVSGAEAVVENASVKKISQPWPLKIDKIATCCNHLNKDAGIDSMFLDSDNLLDCVRSRSGMDDQEETTKATKVAIMSLAVPVNGDYSMPGIANFTQYQIALMSAYAVHNSYVFKSFYKNRDIAHEPRDVRWNKVKLFSEALDPVTGWARHADFLVWIGEYYMINEMLFALPCLNLDADAIVLDFGLRFETIAAQYPQADIIASADIRMGLMNTGFMLLRNTPWTREFVSRWWGVADRGTVCDQDAFDLLYKQYVSEEKSSGSSSVASIGDKVRILSMDRLNSHPPAMLHQEPHNPVLHLMGETSAMRTAVFRRAFTAVCEARSGGVLPPQLGISRQVLLSTAR